MGSKFSIGVLVANRAGVLQRISALFGRRSFNIDSLTVGETENPLLSRITITATGDDYMREQFVRQMQKLVDVKSVSVLKSDQSIYRELLLIKVAAEATTQTGKRSAIIEAANIYRANIVDLSPEALTIELTGESNKIDAFIDYMRPYGIIELCRTGVSAMERGANPQLLSGLPEDVKNFTA